MNSPEIKGFARDPSTQIIPTLGLKVCRHCLHWAIWIPRVLKLQTRFTVPQFQLFGMEFGLADGGGRALVSSKGQQRGRW